MKLRNKRSLLASLIMLTVLAALTAEPVDFSIRFLDKQVYYAGRGPIYIQCTITNTSAETYRFFLADERAFTIDFDVRTMTNRSLDASEILIRKRTQNQQVFFREVLIKSGESFSFAEDLTDYIKLDQSGSYVVQARLYPDLYQKNYIQGRVLESNRLALNLRTPPLSEPGKPPVALDVETNAVLVRQNLPPDQVIEYMLTARQKSQWEKFFLYLDIEAMVTRDGVRK
ncbi:MAG: hypothetical protein SNJ56_05040, partial [Termitinemataceae bacterium]